MNVIKWQVKLKLIWVDIRLSKRQASYTSCGFLKLEWYKVVVEVDEKSGFLFSNDAAKALGPDPPSFQYKNG